jgi:hypothetical protein
MFCVYEFVPHHSKHTKVFSGINFKWLLFFSFFDFLISPYCYVGPCSLVEVYLRYGTTYCSHFRLDFKSRRNSTRLHSVTSQKTIIFIVTSVRSLYLFFCPAFTFLYQSANCSSIICVLFLLLLFVWKEISLRSPLSSDLQTVGRTPQTGIRYLHRTTQREETQDICPFRKKDSKSRAQYSSDEM